jgi:hypothetical protein
MSFIEVLVGAALISLIFGGIIAGAQMVLTLLSNTRAQSGALALANERIEYMRALPYDSVGTVAGIPSGAVPQNESLSLNGITYNRRTLVQYVDAAADGLGVADVNGITADYKRIKAEVSWTHKETAHSVILVTNVIPKGIETLAGGGTLVVNVFDAAALPVFGATVRVVNASTSPAIDVSSFTTAEGQVMFPGAPEGGNYQITVSKTGYSTSQTYSASTSNPNPNPPHVAVVEGDVSTVNFAVDRTGQMTVMTVHPPSLYFDKDTFDDASKLTYTASTSVAFGMLTLTNDAGVYRPEGTAQATTTAPANLISWSEAMFDGNTPGATQLLVEVHSVDGGGGSVRVPDTDLPGNSAGFTTSPIDLTSVAPSTYPRLALVARLTSTDASTSPSVNEWGIKYEAANVPVPNISFTAQGLKNIGTDGGGVPVPKYHSTQSTNALGTKTLPDLEWDTYNLMIDGAAEGYDISDVCPRLPLSLSPNEATSTTLVLSPHTSRSLRVFVRSVSGQVLSGTSVRLYRGGYDTTITTSACGNAFFANPPSASDYTLETTAAGFQADTLGSVTIAGTDILEVTLTPL